MTRGEPGGAASPSVEQCVEVGAATRDVFHRLSRVAASLLDAPAAAVVVSARGRPAVLGYAFRGEARTGPVDRAVPAAVWERVRRSDGRVVRETGARREESGDRSPVLSYACAPLRSSSGVVIGCLCAWDTRRRRWTSRQRTALEDLGVVVESGIRYRLAARAARRRSGDGRGRGGWRLLADASAAFAAAAEVDTTLRTAAGLALPEFADQCVVHVLDDEVQRVEVAHVDPARRRLAEDVERRVPLDLALAAGRDAVQALRAGRSVLVAEVTDAWIERACGDRDHAGLVRRTGLRSLIVAPLVARGRALGWISFAITRSERRYGAVDRELAEELARRVAVAVDNACLHRRAEAASRAKSEFMAMMSHELRTPLGVITGFVDLWLMGVPAALPPAIRSQAERLRVSARHLQQMIEEILGFSRLEAGQETPRLEPVVVAGDLRAAAALVEPMARAKALRFDVDVAGAEATVETDPTKLRQILVNLLSNAVKFTQRGEVRVEARVDAGRLVVAVSDTGIGIAPEHRERIFEPFWQAVQSTTRTAGGTGLGLTVARRLARLLGGDVIAASQPGIGSTFTVDLPAAPSTRAG